MSIYPKTFFKESKNIVIPKTCFVIMPFGYPFDKIYQDVIKRTLEKYRFKVIRADELYGSTPIMEDILRNIERSEIIIADLSGKNPNVFYELGIAHTRKKNFNVVMISQDIKDVPFDLRAYRVYIYKPTPTGTEELAAKLEDYLKEYLAKPLDWAGNIWKPISPLWFKDENFLVGELVNPGDVPIIFNTTPLKNHSKVVMNFRAYSTGPEINFIFFSDGKHRFSGYHLWFWQGGVKLSRLVEDKVVAENNNIKMRKNRYYDIKVIYSKGKIVVLIEKDNVIEYQDFDPLHKKAHLKFIGFDTYHWEAGGIVRFAELKITPI